MTTSVLRGFGFAILLGLAWLVGQLSQPTHAAPQTGGLPALERRVESLEAMVAELKKVNTDQAEEIAALGDLITAFEDKTASISVVGNDFMITGKNVFILDGSGDTKSTSGLGNLTIGYNAGRQGGGDDRSGAHNLILGDENNYGSYGGLVAGNANTISGPYATVLGGFVNKAKAFGATVSGGEFNIASGVQSAVLGGSFNEAAGDNSTVSGGTQNEASADNSSVSGGLGRVAPFIYNWAAGGLFQDH
jgi:hypothetical protein